MKTVLAILLPFWCFAQPATDSLLTKTLQPTELQADFRYLRQLLEETHPGLYRYTPKAQMQAKLDSIDRSLSQPMPFYAFYQTLAKLMADIRCAHTHALPQENWQAAFGSVQKTIPFFIVPLQQRSYVLFSGLPDSSVQPGFELLTINGQSLESIRKQLYPYHWGDGFIQTSHEPVLRGQLFALFYYWFIDQPDTYRLTFRTLTGDTLMVNAPAQSFSKSLKIMHKNPVNRQMMTWYNRKKPKKPWRLTVLDDVSQTASLRLDAFGGEGANNSDEAVFRMRTFMDKQMAQIQQRNIKNLIVDVRSNPGGWDAQGIELLTYLVKADTAFTYYTRQHSITDSSAFLQFSDLSEEDRRNVRNELLRESDGTFTLKQDGKTAQSKRYEPKANRFRGRVYVLMNGETASTASEFVAVAQANQIGVFVGDESGGAYEGGNGASFVHLNLPHSKIRIGTPLVFYRNAVPTPAQPGRGTLPDHVVRPEPTDLLNHTDRVFDFVKELIRTGQ